MSQPREEAAELARGAVDDLPAGELQERIAAARAERRPLRVKLGIDPTAPDIHLGHAVVLRKLRQFQDAGHRVILIIGDFTARVGDPSGRSALRPILSPEQIDANAATFQRQALRVLADDPELLEVRHNSEWLEMPPLELLTLMRNATAAQLLEREDFARRLAAREPISLLEMLYPLLQGYDSVAVRADVELGGTDQKFNLIFGRDVQRAYGVPQQAILTMPILVGIDGARKMSKSLGNQIGVSDEPAEIYGKTMAIPDEAMGDYYRLLLGREPPPQAAAGAAAARDAKRELARALVAWLHGEDAARRAEAHFERVFVERGEPEQIDELLFDCVDGRLHVPGVMAEAFGTSRSEARRLIDQGGVALGGRTLTAGELDVDCAAADGEVLRAGKRRFVRLRRR